jgi:hypothetical protein
VLNSFKTDSQNYWKERNDCLGIDKFFLYPEDKKICYNKENNNNWNTISGSIPAIKLKNWV